MGILILIVVGAVFGWLATIILAIEDNQLVIRHAAIGSGGAVFGGFAASGGQALSGLTPLALLTGIIGSVVGLAVYRYVQRTEIR